MGELTRLGLDGAWDFQFGPAEYNDLLQSDAWRSAIVPMPWQAQFEDLRLASGTGWYRRTFAVDPQYVEQEGRWAAVLHFGAVNYQAAVWLNGAFVGEHEGGYLPFEFDVLELLREGENTLLVRAVDPADDRRCYPDFPFSEVPHGKQSWYGPIGGIWQSAWLEFRPALHIAALQLHSSPADKAIAVEVKLSRAPQGNARVVCTAATSDGRVVGTVTLDGELSGTITLDESPRLWSPQTPELYTVSAVLYEGGSPTHESVKTCGFRTVEARDGRIYLNGEPIYLRGMLDQAYYPQTIYTPPSLEFLEEQARLAKALGFNCLRAHIKIEDPRYYDVADRLGLLIWTEIPNWILLTESTAGRALDTFKRMVERDGHHPSIFAWTLINENWGTDLTRNVAHRRWLADFYQIAREIDPTRLIVDNSACCDNAHVAGDLEDFHHYRAIPDHARQWDEWVADFAGRAEWAWYPDFEQERRDDLPLIVSEFGNWGLPDPQGITEAGAEPWWFETGIEWDGGIVYPHGVLQRYETSGLGDLFPSYADFARQSQEHMARSLHYEIGSMRLHDSIAGYVITEFTDVHWECNGLLTMQRQVKQGLDPLLKDINQDRVVLLRPAQWSGRPGEQIEVIVKTKGVAGEDEQGAIHWRARHEAGGAESGKLRAPGGIIAFTLEQPGMVALEARWLDAEGALAAQNRVDVVCAGPQASSARPRLQVIDSPSLVPVLQELGYEAYEGDLSGGEAAAEIVVAGQYTRALEQHLHAGGRVLLLADSFQLTADSFRLPAGYLVQRAGTSWQGDWATSFSWVKKSGPLAHLPGGPLLDMAWEPLMPDTVLAGLPQWALRSHSWAGMALGWIHRTVSLLALLNYGRGRLLVTTFKLNAGTLAENAVAQALFSGLLEMV